MITYTYAVRKDGITTDIQSVINKIYDELSADPNVSQDIVVTVGAGSYSGFTIPDACLVPFNGTSYRLIIKAESGTFPIIDYNYSDEDQTVGIDIGSGNTNVTIDGLRVQFFAVGIRFGLNSHYPVVKNCIIYNNRNVGIFFEQVIQAQASQCVVVNGDYGIVVRKCRAAALVHNTIFMNGGIATTPGKSISAIWGELAFDYGAGLVDTGVLHLIGNIAWNTSGRCLTLFYEDIERTGSVISNYNNWVIGDKDNFIVIEDNAFYSNTSTPRLKYNTLQSWKSLGFDTNSKSQDPRFISPIKTRKDKVNYEIDLNILNISPVLAMVPSFAYNITAASTWLPSYVDSSIFAKDILGFNRNQDFTAAGTNDKASTSGFHGQDILSQPYDFNLNKSCETEPFINVIEKTLDIWFPKLNRGYFYSNEREFYLYSKKACKYIGELAVTLFTLPGVIAINKDITVTVAGKDISSDYYDISGNKLKLYHRDLPIVHGEEEIEISASVSSWHNNSFAYTPTVYRLKINEGTTRYYLTEDYVPIGPVVVTDDKTNHLDDDIFCNREFSIKFDSLEQKSELILYNKSNKIHNSQFDYYDEDGKPFGWQSYNVKVLPAVSPQYAAIGTNVCVIQNQGYLRKMLPLNINSHSTLSFFTRSSGRGQCRYTIQYFDINQDSIGTTHTGTFNLLNDWTRYSISIDADHTNFSLYNKEVKYKTVNLGTTASPTGAAYILIKVEHIYNPAYRANMHITGFQYEFDFYPTLYHRKIYLNELTVEYETDSSDYFIDKHQAVAPVRNLITEGFIYIPEIPASVYGGPMTPTVSTLHEWKWPVGRINILPWSRPKGKDKLRKRPNNKFHNIPQVKPEQIVPVTSSSPIKDISLYPVDPIAVIGDPNGVGLFLKVVDDNNNPCALCPIHIELFDDRLQHPGVLHKRLYGLTEQLSTMIATTTDNYGSVSIDWIGPSKEGTYYTGPVPIKQYTSNTQDSISVIKTEYPVYTDFGGNIIIFDYLGNPIKTYADNPISRNYEPTYISNRSRITTEYPIKPGTVVVQVEGIYYTESPSDSIESNQFFVNYTTSTIEVKDRVTNISVQYVPNYVYVSDIDPYRIFIYHDKVFGQYESTISVGYDILLKLSVRCYDPPNQQYFDKVFKLVCQNSLMSSKRAYNVVALDI